MWVVSVEEGLDGFCAVDGGVGEEGAIVVGEACHDGNVAVELAGSEELGGRIGYEVVAASFLRGCASGGGRGGLHGWEEDILANLRRSDVLVFLHSGK